MRDVVPVDIKASIPQDLGFVRAAEAAMRNAPNQAVDALRTEQFLYAGLYVRTLSVPAGVVFTGAMVNPDTVMIVSGDLSLTCGDGTVKTLMGYNVLRCAGKRKQLFRTHTDVNITIVYPTKATTTSEGEKEFTDEWTSLIHHED